MPQEQEKILQQHIAVENARLDRIEEKIDKLAETVISLARAEEKLVALTSDSKDTRARLRKVEEDVQEVDRRVDEFSVTIKVINRIFWIVVSVSITAVIGTIFMQQ